MYVKIMDGVAATVSAGPLARAFGTIQDVAKASHVDAETVTLHDGYGSRIFEYDVSGNGVTAGRVNVDISGATDAASVGVILAAAINSATHADGTAFAITAVHVATGLVYLRCDNFGTIGNQSISETVANGGYTVANMAGAVDGVSLRGGRIPGDTNAGLIVDGLDDCLFVMESRSGSGTMTWAGRLWVYVPIPKNLTTPPNSLASIEPGVWCPAGIATTADTDRGFLNNAVAVAESFSLSDYLSHTQTVGNLNHCLRAFMQTTTLGGTAPIVDGWIVARTASR